MGAGERMGNEGKGNEKSCLAGGSDDVVLPTLHDETRYVCMYSTLACLRNTIFNFERVGCFTKSMEHLWARLFILCFSSILRRRSS